MSDIDTTQKKILVVEDEKPLRRAVCDTLIHEGFVALEAKDGQEGVTQAITHKPDLILMDILMPNMDGRAALKEIRANPATEQIPVVMLTNMSDMSYVAEVTSYPKVDYLVKSDWSITDVLGKIRQMLG
ncbi:MAG: response regulator [Parcubacteria group bacterium]|nr:response regulator [Parcubacteria group bacterium]